MLSAGWHLRLILAVAASASSEAFALPGPTPMSDPLRQSQDVSIVTKRPPDNATANNQFALQNDNPWLPDNHGTCTVHAYKEGLEDTAGVEAMKDCLEVYMLTGWRGMECGGKGWFKGHWFTYLNEDDCMKYCATCLTKGIETGAESIKCEHLPVPGVAICWVGFH